MTNTLSIIIPAYKTEKTIVRCLDSVFAQIEGTEFDESVEVVAVNDCSPDSVGEILQRYQQEHQALRVITHECNKGEAGAHNTGMVATSGEYFLRLDSDDTFRPNAIKKIFAAIDDGHPDIILHPFAKVDENGKLLGETELMGNGLYQIDTQSEEERKVVFQEVAFGIMTGRVVYRRAAAPTVRQDPKYPIAGDRYFGWQFFAQSKTVYILNEMLVNYYIYPNSMSRVLSDKAIVGLLELDIKFWKEMREHKQFATCGRYAFRRLFPGILGWHYSITFNNTQAHPEFKDLYFRTIALYMGSKAAYQELWLWPFYLKVAALLKSRRMIRFYWFVHEYIWIRIWRKVARLLRRG